MKVAIVGSRRYGKLRQVREYVANLPDDTIVVSGGARGVDETAEGAARERGLTVHSFPADWWRHGRGAGFIRNREIVFACDELVAFWDGQSRGTLNSVGLAREAGKHVRVFREYGES